MHKVAASAALLLTTVTLLAACGSSAKSPAAGDTPTTNAPADAGFSKLLGNLGKQPFKVTYTDAVGNTQVYAQDGAGKTVTVNGDNQVYTTRTSAITCEKLSGSSSFSCRQSPINLGANSSYIALSVAEKTYATALAYRFGNTSSKSIAGRDADCFSITAKDFEGASGIAGAAGASLKGTTTYCNDRETGAALENTFIDDSGERTTNLLVTKFGPPTASDFEPPATPTVVTMPGGPITVPGGVGAQ